MNRIRGGQDGAPPPHPLRRCAAPGTRRRCRRKVSNNCTKSERKGIALYRTENRGNREESVKIILCFLCFLLLSSSCIACRTASTVTPFALIPSRRRPNRSRLALNG